MKYKQIIFSPTGGTQKVAEIITAEWSREVETVDLARPEDFSKYDFQAEDLVLIALPSYGGRAPALAAQRLAQIRGNGAKCVLLCVYGNRAYEDTLVEMEDIAKACGFEVWAAVAAVAEHSIMRQYAAGRPDEQDVEQLKCHARTILEKLEVFHTVLEPDIPGGRPYKKAGGAGLVPKATKQCTKCGLCAEKCPAQAISPERLEGADASKCISCMRCVAICPQAARKANGAMIAVAAMALKKACAERKECELFI